MKTLCEILNNYNADRIAKNEWFYNELTEYYQKNNIPNIYAKLYESYNLLNFDYLNENLKTHNYQKLQQQLLKEFGNFIDKFINYSGSDNIKSFYIILKNQKPIYNLNKNSFDDPSLSIKNIVNRTKEVENFFSILDFLNYRYSNWQRIDNMLALYIEPIYSEDASDYFNKCHRQGYHFTNKNNIQKILKCGLRIKHGIYRDFPNRIYLWVSDEKKLDKNKIEAFIKQLYEDSFLIDNVGIIKVDLHNYDIPIYKDTAMQDKEALFVYNNIPANLCKEIKL